MRLWLRLGLLVAMIASVPAVWIGSVALHEMTVLRKLRPEEAVVREATTVATFVGTWLSSQASSLAGWARVWDIDRFDEPYQVGLLRAVYQGVDSVVVVGLIDQDGEQVAPAQFLGPEEARAEGRTPADAARVTAMMASLPAPGAGATLGAPYAVSTGDVPAVAVSVPAGELVLVADLGLDPLAGIFAASPGQVTALLDGEGRFLFGGDDPLVRDLDLDALLGLGEHVTSFDFSADPPVRGAVAGVPGTPWRVIVVEPAELAERAAAEVRSTLMKVGAALIAMIALLALVILSVVTVPLNRLRSMAARVAEGDFGVQSGITARDELGDLARAFDDMSTKLLVNHTDLLASKAEIESLNQDLQRRIEEATAALRAAQDRLVQTRELAAVGEVGAGLAHEINNPLATALGLVQVLRTRWGAEDSEEHALITEVERQALRCREVVATWLRLAAGEMDLDAAPVIDLQYVLKESIQGARDVLQQRDVQVDFDPPPSALRVRMEPHFAQDALRRLLVAVASTMVDGGRIRVGARALDGEIHVTVLAEGAFASDALPEGAVDDWRASGSSLWVARRLVQLSGGRVVPPGHTSSPQPHADGPGGATAPAWRVVLPEA